MDTDSDDSEESDDSMQQDEQHEEGYIQGCADNNSGRRYLWHNKSYSMNMYM